MSQEVSSSEAKALGLFVAMGSASLFASSQSDGPMVIVLAFMGASFFFIVALAAFGLLRNLIPGVTVKYPERSGGGEEAKKEWGEPEPVRLSDERDRAA